MNVLNHKIDRLAVLAVAPPFPTRADDRDLALQPLAHLRGTRQSSQLLRQLHIREQIVQHHADVVQTISDNAPQLACRPLQIIRRYVLLMLQPANILVHDVIR
ncbi:hypothetical protein D3C84_909510 [compost metagenome]